MNMFMNFMALYVYNITCGPYMYCFSCSERVITATLFICSMRWLYVCIRLLYCHVQYILQLHNIYKRTN